MNKTSNKRGFLSLLTIMLVIVAIFTTSIAPAYAAEAKTDKPSSALTKAFNKQQTAIKNYGDYFGWDCNSSTIKNNSSEIRKEHKFYTGSNGAVDWILTVTQSTKPKKGGGYTTTFKVKKTIYPLANIGNTFRKYGVRSKPTGKVQLASFNMADDIAQYALDRGWEVTTHKYSYSKDKKIAYDTLTFKNSKYQWTAKVTTKAKSGGGYSYSYKRNDKASTLKAIKQWLEQYKK